MEPTPPRRLRTPVPLGADDPRRGQLDSSASESPIGPYCLPGLTSFEAGFVAFVVTASIVLVGIALALRVGGGN